MGWSSQILRRLLVGSPLPPSTGTGIIAGPAAYLPPPLDTYLTVGMVWVTEGTMSYIGILDVLGTPTTEHGFVTPDLSIIPIIRQQADGVDGSSFDFQGGPFNFITFGDNQVLFEDTTIGAREGQWHWYNLAGTSNMYITPPVAEVQFDNWYMGFDGDSQLYVPLNSSVTSGQATGDYSFTNTAAYNITTSAGVYFSVGTTFFAPASGVVDLFWRGQVLNSVATNQTFISPVVREGGTIGAGSVVLAAADTRAMVSGITSANPGQSFVGAFCQATGLTPKSQYNVRLEHRVNAGTGRTLLGEILVKPSLG